ncbi:MAG: class III signal peptide-containing protein [Candidatus Diapherotrites archaeon]|nr:class III signal peptide-containing protein [Candidatus Diapherotrites archaeon]
MDSKGQGALEYLLLIGAAVLIAAVVIILLTSSASSGKGSIENSQGTYNSSLANLGNVA